MRHQLQNPAQYRLGVQIGHLLATAIRDGMAHQHAVEVLRVQATNVAVAAELGDSFTTYRRSKCPVCGGEEPDIADCSAQR